MTDVSPVGIAPASLDANARRLFIYVVWDRRGEVEDYIPYALAGMRSHAAHILVVINGALSAEGRAALEPVSDEILVRENVGFDIWAHKDALDHMGDRLGDFDELVLTNDTWFGPVRPYAGVLSRMDARPVHFWGMTDHAREEPNPFTGDGVLHYHLQSFWIAVRREMFLSERWKQYWHDLPDMPGYFDAVLQHETVFTEHFASAGFTHDVAFASEDYPTDHPALFNPDLLLADGCPLLKRRPFFHYPPFLDRHAVIGREILRDVAGHGYPMPLIWEDLARNVAPKTLNADAGALEVLPEVDVSYDATRPFRVAVVMDIEHVEMADELLDRASCLPDPFDLIITTTSPSRARQLRETLDRRADSGVRSVDVRVLPSELGRHMSAFFIGCRDVLLDGRHDLVVKLHSKRSSRKSFNVSRYFTRHQLENLLSSPGYAANILALFQREPGLGLVFPPAPHIGIPTSGAGWSLHRPRAEALARSLGIRVPMDEVSPLAPLGGMFVCRPEALRLLSEHEWHSSDYAASQEFPKAPLGPTQERLLTYAAGERGFHSRTVMNAEHADISHTALEFKLDQLASTTPGYPIEQIQFLHRSGPTGRGSALDLTRMYLRLNHPEAAKSIAPFTAAARGAVHRLKSLRLGSRRVT
ncbi:rhamnan synthesis F family protein [Microbacterium sp. DT81.1]|uniref:rhamnan synthesis F family protein n=1 Tax=Microbacterium sp. DT81.1 TaxID=3393413 RepID=UPI003CF9233E